MSKVRYALAALFLCLLPQLAHGQASDTTLIRSSVEPLPACIPAAQGQLQPMVWDVTTALTTPDLALKVCSAVNTWTSVGAISGGGTIAGSIAVNQVGFGAGTDVLAGQSNFLFNSGTGFLSVPSITDSVSLTAPLINNVFAVDGVTYTTVQSAISAACTAGGGTVNAAGLSRTTQTVSSLISLGCANGDSLVILFDPSTKWIPANTTVNMFLQLPNAQVSNLEIDYTSVSGYSGIAYQLSGHIYNNQPGQSTSSFTDASHIAINGTGNTTATNFLFQAVNGSSDYIQFTHFHDLKAWGGLYGMLINTANSSWWNGNIIDGFQDTVSVYPLKFVTANLSTCNINAFNDLKIEGLNPDTTIQKAIWMTGTYECNFNQFLDVQLWDLSNTTTSIQIDEVGSQPPTGNNFTGVLRLDIAPANADNNFCDTSNGFCWGVLNYEAGAIISPYFNATTPLSGYRINNNTVLNADSSNTYLSAYSSTGSTFLSIGPSGGPNQYFFSLNHGTSGGAYVTIPGTAPTPTSGAGRPPEGSLWFDPTAVSGEIELNGFAERFPGYNLIENNAVSVAQERKLNFTGGGCVDNSGAGRTDCSFVPSTTQSANSVLAGPTSGSPATPAFRALVTTDVPTLNQNTTGTSGGLTGCAVSTVGSVCYWTGSAWTVLGGNASGTQYLQETSSGIPSWTVPSGSGAFAGGLGASFQDVTEIAAPANPSAGNDRLYLNSSTHQLACLTSSGGSCVPSSGGGVSSVGLSQTGSFFTITGSPITTSGTINLAFANESANTIFAGPISGSAAAPTFRSMVAADVPTLNQNTTGTAGGLTGCSTSTAGSICYWTGSAWTVLAGNASGTQFLQETSSGVPSWAVAGGGNVSSSGTPTAHQTAIWTNSTTILGIGPGTTALPLVSGGASADPSYAALTSAGLNITPTACTNQVVTAIGSGAVGSCTTVTNAMLANSSVTINNPSFMTGWGSVALGASLSPSWSSETANTFLSAPNGSPGAPTFRTIVSADIPTLNQNTTGTSGGLTGCSTSTAGSICYWTGSAWTVLAGNTTSIQYLQETSSGVPSWSAGSTTVSLSNIANASGTNVLSNGNNPQTWNWAQTTASHTAMAFGETTAATGSGDIEVGISTAAGSTAIPLSVSDSLTGSQALSALSITPTWNTTGVVDAALKINVTNTASGTGSLLADFQIAGSSEFTVDKLGNVVATGSVGTGTGSTGCGTATGCISENEGSTAAATASGADTIRADSTAHNFKCSLNGASEFQCAAGYAVQGTDTKVLSSGTISGSAGTAICLDGNSGATTSGCMSGTPSFPQTVAGTVTSGGIPYFNSTVQESSSGILNTNVLVKGGGAGGAPTNSSITDNGTLISTSENISFGGTGTDLDFTTGTANQNINIFSGNGTFGSAGTGYVALAGTPGSILTKVLSTGLLGAYAGITGSSTTGALDIPYQIGWVSCTNVTPCASSYTTVVTTGATTLYSIHASADCSSSTATATAAISIKYTDTSSTVQTIAPAAAACTTLGSGSVQTINQEVLVLTGTNIQYEVTTANTPVYAARVSIHQEGSN